MTTLFPSSISSFTQPTNPSNSLHRFNTQYEKDIRNSKESGFYSYGMDETLRNASYFSYAFGKNRTMDDTYDPYVTAGLGGEKDEIERLNYLRGASTDRSLNPTLELEELARKNLAERAFTAFNSEIYNLTLSGNKVLGRIIGAFNIYGDTDSSLSEVEQERRKRNFDKFSASTIYQHIFNYGNYTYGKDRVYAGLGIDYKRTPLPPDTSIDEARTLMRDIVKGEEFTTKSNVLRIHKELVSVYPEILTTRKYGQLYPTDDLVSSISKRIIDDSDYTSKPGIRQAISLIESSNDSLTIDLFQLQNKAISDVLISKLQREKQRIRSGDFKVNIRLSAPSNSNRANIVGYQILGPNILIMERLMRVRDEIARDIPNDIDREKLMTSGFRLEFIDTGSYHAKVFTNDRVAQLGSFNWTSPVGNSVHQSGSNYEEIHSFHNKLDELGVYDSLKRTLPSSQSIGNYMNTESGMIAALKELGSKSYTSITSKEEQESYRSSKLFLQTRLLNQRGLYREQAGNAFTRSNVGLAGDIGQALRTTIQYLSSNKGSGNSVNELYMNLNQVWLLQLDNSLYYGSGGDYRGEMGPMDDNTDISNLDVLQTLNSRRRVYREQQKDLFKLILEGRAYVSVDPRNYREKILHPMEEKVKLLLGRIEADKQIKASGIRSDINTISKEQLLKLGTQIYYKEFNGSISNLTNRVGNSETQLLKLLGLDTGGINRGVSLNQLGINASRISQHIATQDASFTAQQLLAVGSGNIIMTTETMSHVKNFVAIQRQRGKDFSGANPITPLAYYSGSSNLGYESTAFNRSDDGVVSTEAGLILMNKELRTFGTSKGYLETKDAQQALRDEEEGDELTHRFVYPFREWERLTQTSMLGSDPTQTGTQSIWESKVSAWGLHQMKERIEQMNKSLGYSSSEGIRVTPIYGSKGDITSYMLQFSTKSMSGGGYGDISVGYQDFKYRVTVLKDLSGKPGMVYFIDQNKVVGNSILFNKTGHDISGIPFGMRTEDGFDASKTSSLKDRESLRLSPLDTLVSLMATMSGEVAYRTLVEHPMSYLHTLKEAKTRGIESSQPSMLGKAGLDYLKFLGTGSNTPDGTGEYIKFFETLDIETAHTISKKFGYRHVYGTTQTGKRALELSAGLYKPYYGKGDGNESHLTGRIDIMKNVMHIATINQQIAKATSITEINTLKQYRTTLLTHMMHTFDELVDTQNRSNYQADIGLGIVESRRDPFYYQKSNNILKNIKSGLLEPFITIGQASFYGASQAWFRNPLYEITSRHHEVLAEGLQGMRDNQGSLNQIFRYAMAQPYIYGPTDTLGTNIKGMVRSVAEGGGASETVEDGFSLFGRKKANVGDVMDMEIITYAGVGNITTRNDLERRLLNLLYSEYSARYESLYGRRGLSKDDFIHAVKSNVSSDKEIISASNKFRELIDMTPLAHKNIRGENYIDEYLTFTFSGEAKLPQVPQRLKNVIGSKPMYEIDTSFGYLTRSRGRSKRATQGGVTAIGNYDTDYKTLQSIIHRTQSIDSRYLFAGRTDVTFTTDDYLEGIHRFRKAQLMETILSKYEGSSIDQSLYLQIIEEIKKEAILKSSTSMTLELERLVDTLSGINEDTKRDITNKLKLMYKEVSEVLSSDSKLALINMGGIRIGLTEQQHEMIGTFKSQLRTQYGFREEDFQDDSHIARYMLISALRSTDMLATGIKGFTGGKTQAKGSKSFILVQTSGAYSDYAYTNPLYGTDIEFLNQVRSKLGNARNSTYIPGYGHINTTNWESLSLEDKDKLGMLTGFTEKAEKRQKSSMLVEDWYVNGSMLAQAGDIITYDLETNRVLVWGSKASLRENQIPKDRIDMSKLSNGDKEALKKAALGGDITKAPLSINNLYYLKESVDSRDQVSAISGVIDNFRTIDDLPNVSLLERQTWYRNAEQSIEYLLSAKQLTGIADNSQLLWEFIYNRSILMGGGRRVEGIGMLAKAVSIMADPSLFEIILPQIAGTSGAFGQVTTDLHNIAGLYNPSNLKSYIASHGQEIIRHESYMNELLKSLNGSFLPKGTPKSHRGIVLSSAILMAFGDSFIKDKAIRRSVYSHLFQKAINNEMGGWMRNIAITSILTGTNSNKLLSKLNDISTSLGGTVSHSDIISAITNPSSILHSRISSTHKADIMNLLSDTFGDTMTKALSKMSNITQVPINKVINEELFLRAIQGDNNSIKYLNKLVESYINPESLKQRRTNIPGVIGKVADYVITNRLEERNAALAAGNLDIIIQLMSQKDLVAIPTDINLNDNRTLLTLLAITGHSELGSITEKIRLLDTPITPQEKEDIEKELDVLRSFVRGMTLTSNVLKLKADFIASQSKEPVGSKHTGGLEFQHLVKALHQNADHFSKTGSLAELRKVMANIFASISQTESMTTMNTIMQKAGWLGNTPIYDISDVQSISVIHAHKFLGLYEGMSIEDQNLLRQVRNDFKQYGKVVETITSHLMSELGNISGNTLQDRAKRVALTNEIQDLLTIMPEVAPDESSIFNSRVKYLVEDSNRPDYIGVKETSEGYRLKTLIEKYLHLTTGLKDSKGKPIDTDALISRISSLQTVLAGRGYQLDPNKAFGMGSIQPIIEGLDYKSFMFSLPSFFVEGQTEEGGIKLRFDYSKEAQQYSYLMSSQELKVLGDQYGSYVDELVAKTIMLASAFTPGTEMNSIRNLIQRSKMSGDSSIELSKEEYERITKFYDTAVGQNSILSLMAEAGADVRSQQVAAGKVRLRGIVTIPAASFLVSPGSILLASEGERRQIQMSYDRYQAYLGAQGKYNKIENMSVTTDPLEMAYRRRMSNYYKAMQDTTLYGLSEEGSRSHQQVLDMYKDLKRRVLNAGNDLVQLSALEEELSRLKRVSNVRTTEDNKGNVYVKRLGEVLQVDLLDLINKGRRDKYNALSLGTDDTYKRFNLLIKQYETTVFETDPNKIVNSRLRLIDMLFVSRGSNTSVMNDVLDINTKMGITLKFDIDKTYHTAIKEVNKWLSRDPSLRATHAVIDRLLTKEANRASINGSIENELWVDLMDSLKLVGNKDKEGARLIQKLFYRLTPELNRLTQVVTDINTDRPKLLSKGTGDISSLSHLNSYNLIESELEGGLRKRVDPFSSGKLIDKETEKGAFLKYLVDNMKTQFEKGVLEEVKNRSIATHNMPQDQYTSMVNKSIKDISNLVEGLSLVSQIMTTGKDEKYNITEVDIDNISKTLNHIKGLPQGKDKIDRLGVIKLLGLQQDDFTRTRITKGGVTLPGTQQIGISQLKSLVDVLVNSLDSSDVTQVLGFRSPPPGGTEAQRYTLQVLNDIALVNDYSNKANGSMALKYDSSVGRNKSLTLISPISLLTMGLGDFDGDPYTTIYSSFMEHHRSIYKNDTRLNFLKDIKMKEVRDTIDKHKGVLGINLSTLDVSGAETLLSSNTTLNTSHPELYKALKSYISYSSQIAQLEKENALTQSKIQVMNSQLEKSSYVKAVKKEVANYLGISGKYFTSSSEGGFRDTEGSTSVMLTMIEQGAGLFGGIRNKAPAIEATKNLLTDMLSRNNITSIHSLDTKFLQDLIKLGATPNETQLDVLANTLKLKLQAGLNDSTSSYQSSYVGLLMMGDTGIKSLVREFHRDASVAIESINKKYGTQSALDYYTSSSVTPEDELGISNEILAGIAARMLNKQAGLSSAQSIFMSSAGVSIDRGSYDMLTYTMGKAGGDILGKTYNTFIGAIYRDSPLVALGHVMQDENLNDALRDHFAINSGSINGMTYDDFKGAMDERVRKAEALQGYIKNINQFLRDGIKPKIQGGQNLLAQLKEWSQQYEHYEAQGMHTEQEELITKIAGGFGPSGSDIGMNAFIQLSSLVTHRENLIGAGNIASSSIKVVDREGGGVSITMNPIGAFGTSEDPSEHNIGKLLGTLFGITTPFDGSRSNQIDISDVSNKDQLDTFSKIVLQLREQRGGNQFNAFDVAAFKTARDLQGLIIAYQYANLTGAGFDEKGKNITSMSEMLRTTIGRYAIEQGLYDPSNPSASPYTQSHIVNQLMGSGYSHGGITHNQQTINEWLSKSISSDNTYMYLLSAMTGKTEEVVKREYLGIAPDGSFIEDKRVAEKSVMLAVMEHALDVTQGLYGEAGEGLYDFTRYEKERKRLMSQLGGGAEITESEGTGASADLWHTVMSLMAGNKLSPHAASLAFRTIIETQKGVANEQASMIDMLSGITSDGDMSYVVGTNPTPENNAKEEQFRQTLRTLLEDKSKGKVGGADLGDGTTKGWFYEYVSKMMESTATNLKNEALHEFFTAATGNKDAVWGDPNSLLDNIIDKSQFSEDELNKIRSSLNQGISDLREVTIQKLQSQRNVVTNKRSQRINEDLVTNYHSKVLQAAQVDASNANTSLDFIAPILLTVLGAGVMSGNIQEEAVGQAVGGSLMALGYMRSGRMLESLSQNINPKESFLSKTTRSATRTLMGSLVSSSFKLNATLQETQGNLGDAMALSLGREVGFAIGSSLVAPSIERSVMYLSTRHLERTNRAFMEYEVGKLTRGQRLDYMLKGVNSALDIDNFAGTKGALSTVGGALLSSFMGLMMGNMGAQMAASAYLDSSDRKLSEFALVEQGLSVLQDMQMEASRRSYERESTPNIYDEYGYEVEIYEATPFEDYYMRAISDATVPIDQLLQTEDQANLMVFPDLNT